MRLRASTNTIISSPRVKLLNKNPAPVVGLVAVHVLPGRFGMIGANMSVMRTSKKSRAASSAVLASEPTPKKFPVSKE